TVASKIGCTLDILPTICQLAGVEKPTDRIIDGYDLSAVWQKNSGNPRNEMFYYHGTRLFAVRKGHYKIYCFKNNPDGYPERIEELEKPHLFNLSIDPSERFEIGDKYPEVVADLKNLIEYHKANMVIVPSNLEKRMVE
ncbi:MAG TPA: hypothetical protein PKD85_05385, partial [Saprospiraceae bacterium]|nr:hypothetical protein [Saprospiraceae bacterium]